MGAQARRPQGRPPVSAGERRERACATGTATAGPRWLAPALRRSFVEQQDRWAWKVGSSGPRWWRHLSDQLVEAPNRDLRIDYLRHRARRRRRRQRLAAVRLRSRRLLPEAPAGARVRVGALASSSAARAARPDAGRGQAQPREGGLLVLLLRDPHESRRTGNRAPPATPRTRRSAHTWTWSGCAAVWYHGRPAPGKHTGFLGHGDLAHDRRRVLAALAGRPRLRGEHAGPWRTSAPPRRDGSHSPTTVLFSALRAPDALSRVSP